MGAQVKRPSSVWAVMPELLVMLRSASWPTIPETKAKIDVRFGALATLPGGEAVVLHGTTRRGDQEIATGGTPGKNDVVDAPLSVFTNVPGFSAERTWERLADFGVALDGVFRDLSTGKPIITPALEAAGVWSISVSSIDTDVVPMNAAGSAGWLGMAAFVISWKARL